MINCTNINLLNINNVIEKDDGTVFGFFDQTGSISADTGYNTTINPGAPVSSGCCTTLGRGYTYDTDSCKCLWKPSGNTDYLKLILNPKLDGGEVFEVNSGDTCVLNVELDFLLEFDAYEMMLAVNATDLTYLDVFNDLDISATVEKVEMKPVIEGVIYDSPFANIEVDRSNIITIGDLGDYVSGNTNTGIRLVGDNIEWVTKALKTALSGACSGVSASTFDSCWINHKFTVSDPQILEDIANKKIKLGLEINGVEDVPFSVLVDKLVMKKSCEHVERTDKKIVKCPGFDLQRVIDNRKSWETSAPTDLREYDLELRETNYLASNSDLLINTKELDLQVDPSLAIEANVLSYIENNEDCILSGDPVDFASLLTTELSSITSTDEFNQVIQSELIDVKNRQTIQSYPTLRFLYDKYMDPTTYGCPASGGFKYDDLIKYSKSLGTYWVDIIEQLIPATTIWGSSYVYRNNVFDDNKFKYKQYTLLTCIEPTCFDIVGSATTGVEVIVTDVSKSIIEENEGCDIVESSDRCNSLYILGINSSPEFRGEVTVTSTRPERVINNNCGDYLVIPEAE